MEFWIFLMCFLNEQRRFSATLIAAFKDIHDIRNNNDLRLFQVGIS